MSRSKIKAILSDERLDYITTVKGWVRSFRNNQFIALNDGSCMSNLQVVISLETDEAIVKRIANGAAISATGSIITSLGKGQRVEMKADSIEVLGECNGEEYPLQLKNRPSLEFLREKAHLRFRTNTFGAVFRVRHSLAFAVHQFFNDRGFVYLHTPIITGSDAEGAGEMFRVTTLPIRNVQLRNAQLEELSEAYYQQLTAWLSQRINVKELSQRIKTIEPDFDLKRVVLAKPADLQYLSKKRVRARFSAISSWLQDAYNALLGFLFKEGTDSETDFYHDRMVEILKVKESSKIGRRFKRTRHPLLAFSFFNFSTINSKLKLSPKSEIDFDYDFFSRATNLTVSGQLEAELGAMALGEVYTFGPTFRAENSNTARHLAEFWMIEPEVAFADIHDNMNLAEDFIRYLIQYALQHNREDLEFLAQRQAEEERAKPQNERNEMGLIEKLEFVVSNAFERITYTEAIDILLQSPHYKKKKFEYDVQWGIDLQSEHERYLVEKHFKKPVMVRDYPAGIKAFYMRMNEDGKTVAAMDILAPGIGEIVGGSQREERLDKLEERMAAMHIPADELDWYLDTRRFGTAPHAGFGLGFERMVLFVTGMSNIRDVIPFPRTPGNAAF